MALTHEVLQFKLQSNNCPKDAVIGKIEELLMRCSLQHRIIDTFRSSVKPLMMMITEGGRCTVEVYQDGLVCIDVVQLKENPWIKDLSSVEEEIAKVIAATIPQRRFVIHKGIAPHYLYIMSNEEVVQYKFTSHLYSARSPYQQIDIYDSEEFGAMLFLDYDPNIADSDIIYTKTLTGNGKYDMKNSKILILGGGDGAALREVLTYDPTMVIMIEIDKMVIDAVKQHMRLVSGDVLDQLKGDNYEIIINDCIPIMRELIKKGELFDYILYDLTEIPVSTSDTEEEKPLKFTILDLAIMLLSPSGHCIAQGHKAVCTKSSNLFMEHMKHLHCPVEYDKQSVPVPSYREKWTFYTIWKKEFLLPAH